jgi:hypothetical protein
MQKLHALGIVYCARGSNKLGSAFLLSPCPLSRQTIFCTVFYTLLTVAKAINLDIKAANLHSPD